MMSNDVLNEDQLDMVNGGAVTFTAGAVIAALTLVWRRSTRYPAGALQTM